MHAGMTGVRDRDMTGWGRRRFFGPFRVLSLFRDPHALLLDAAGAAVSDRFDGVVSRISHAW